jgi:hypothetical protein
MAPFHGERVAVIELETPEPMTIHLAGDQAFFDTYWTEVAQPILESIEFVDS